MELKFLGITFGAFIFMMFIFYGVVYHVGMEATIEVRIFVSFVALVLAKLISEQFKKTIH